MERHAIYAEIAQLVEHPHGKGKVTSSNLVLGLLKGQGAAVQLRPQAQKNMARKKPFVKFACKECKRINYYVHKSKGVEGKLKLKKYCKWCRKQTEHKEVK